ncbi:MAG TPA: type II toxin-antitoxin system VapC family toxin [Reyranella sp.]|nr:type II toxin-antitoxin system VapC family toxin [Reyranella sp.]
MKLLIDSNAFIWMTSLPRELSAPARQALIDPANDRFISIASLWEIGIKLSTGKLTLPGTLETAVAGMAAVTLPITMACIKRIQTLPLHHRDPFDRMLIAQAFEEGLTIVTRDRIFQAYGVSVLTA